MKFLSISSGSKGNASYLETGTIKALIDVGVSYSEIKKVLNEHGVDVASLTHIFITHEHIDHIKGLSMTLKHTKAKLYLTEGTQKVVKAHNPIIIKALEEVMINNLYVTPIPLSHDANEPVGFIFKKEDKSICYLTDTGYILSQLTPLLQNHTLYYLEANHDPYTLMHSKRPYPLIRRIMNEKGHLSNEDSAYYFSQFQGQNTRYLIHAHMSMECNSITLVNHTFQQVLNTFEVQDIKRFYAKQNEALEVIVL